MTTRTLLFFALVFPLWIVNAQSPSERDRWADSAGAAIDAATIHGDVQQLREASALVERALTAFPDDPLLLHYLGFARYREATLLMGRGADKDDYAPLLDDADELLERSGKKLELAETFAVRASVLGQKIGSNPFLGMTLGMRSGNLMDRAVELGASNPRVWLLRGVGAMFTPSMFGGGLDKAQEYLTKSIALFATDKPAAPLPAWGHAEAYVWLGQIHQRQGRTDDARQAFARALELEPQYGWVRDVLIPGLDRASR